VFLFIVSEQCLAPSNIPSAARKASFEYFCLVWRIRSEMFCNGYQLQNMFWLCILSFKGASKYI